MVQKKPTKKKKLDSTPPTKPKYWPKDGSKPVPPPAPKGNKYSSGGGAPEKYTMERLEEEAKLLIQWFDLSPRNIWLNNFALQRGYDPGRFDEFEKKSPVFSLALKKAKKMQEAKLVEKGLHNETNAMFTKFVLENNHNWNGSKVSVSGNIDLRSIVDLHDGDSKELIKDLIDDYDDQ